MNSEKKVLAQVLALYFSPGQIRVDWAISHPALKSGFKTMRFWID